MHLCHSVCVYFKTRLSAARLQEVRNEEGVIMRHECGDTFGVNTGCVHNAHRLAHAGSWPGAGGGGIALHFTDFGH